jgi:hypothetical protein
VSAASLRLASPAPEASRSISSRSDLLLERAVEGRLGGLQGAPDHLLDPGGQLRGDRQLRAAQDVVRRLGPQPLVKPSPLLAAGALRHPLKVAGKDELKEGAQVVERVLDGGAREQEPPLGPK